MDDRRRQPEHLDPAGCDEVHRQDWDGADDRRLSGEGSDEQSGRKKFRPARWVEAVSESRQRGSRRRSSYRRGEVNYVRANRLTEKAVFSVSSVVSISAIAAAAP